MADYTPSGPLETGANMDYAEHERTYKLFIALAKYSALICTSTLIAMAFGFFTSAGFFSATVLFLIICAIGAYLLRDIPTHIS